LDTGVITSYALYILVGLTFYIVLPLFYELDNNLLLIIIFALITIKKKIKKAETAVHNAVNVTYLAIKLSNYSVVNSLQAREK